VRVEEICTRDVAIAPPEQSAEEGSRRMRDDGLGTLVVVDALQRPLGIVTDRDVATRCVAEGRDPKRTPLDRLMSGPAAWIRVGAGVDQALAEMARLRVRRLPVVDDRDRLVGILSLDDVLAAELDPESLLGRALREV
jgi:CBS domain-containing protein